MKISPIINNQYIKKHAPSFTSTTRTLYESNHEGIYYKDYYTTDEDYIAYQQGRNPDYSYIKIISSNYTNFFRGDLGSYADSDWKSCRKDIIKQFPADKKVNVYDFGCSDGSEAYSLAISLIEELGEQGAKKFFPIYASDVDKEIIKRAKSGKIKCSSEDIYKINKNCDGKFDKYFSVIALEGGNFILAPKKILTDNIKFSNKDFLTGLDDAKGSNNLILCRNFWRYMSQTHRACALFKMHEQLDESSRIIIGDFDKENYNASLPDFFSYAGFREVSGVHNMLFNDASFDYKKRLIPNYKNFIYKNSNYDD